MPRVSPLAVVERRPYHAARRKPTRRGWFRCVCVCVESDGPPALVVLRFAVDETDPLPCPTLQPEQASLAASKAGPGRAVLGSDENELAVPGDGDFPSAVTTVLARDRVPSPRPGRRCRVGPYVHEAFFPAFPGRPEGDDVAVVAQRDRPAQLVVLVAFPLAYLCPGARR